MAPKPCEHVLRIPLSSNVGDFVLVNVSTNGPNPLDLKVEATEGENPYVGTSEQLILSSSIEETGPLTIRTQ